MMERSTSLKNFVFDEDCKKSKKGDTNICISCDSKKNIKELVIHGNVFRLSKPSESSTTGSTAAVSLYTNEKNETYAIKRFNRESEVEYLSELAKISLLTKSTKYPSHLVPAYGVINDNCFLSIMHFKDGDLFSLLLSFEGVMDTNMSISILNQIVAGMIQLLDLGFYYTDLKPENVLYKKTSENDYKIYLCDLGGIVPALSKVDESVSEIKEILGKMGKNKREMIQEQIEEDEYPDLLYYGLFTFPTANFPPSINMVKNGAQTNMFFCSYYHQICMMYLFLFSSQNARKSLFEHGSYRNINQYADAMNRIYKDVLPLSYKPYFLIQSLSGDFENTENIRKVLLTLKLDAKTYTTVPTIPAVRKIAAARKRTPKMHYTDGGKKTKTKRRRRSCQIIPPMALRPSLFPVS